MSRKNSPSLLFLPTQTLCPIRPGQSVLEVALRNQVNLSHSCGGMGSCTTCRVFVESSLSELPPRTELEEDLATMKNFTPHERLACQLPAQDGMILTIPYLERRDGDD